MEIELKPVWELEYLGKLLGEERLEHSIGRDVSLSADLKELQNLEARVGIEPTHKGFADLSLTTWVPRRYF
jgi:hypothetical protein